MSVAIIIEIPHSPQLQAGFGIAFGVTLHHLHPVVGYKGNKRNKMLLRHGMLNSDEVFVLHMLNCDGVVFVCRLRFQCRKGNTAAADQSISVAVDHIAADGTDIEFAPQQICCDIFIDDVFFEYFAT